MTLRAGETATVTIGGSGRAVSGRAVAPESLGADVWTENSVALILKVPTPGAPQAPNLDDFPTTREFQAANEEYSSASLAYWNSDAGDIFVLSRPRCSLSLEWPRIVVRI